MNSLLVVIDFDVDIRGYTPKEAGFPPLPCAGMMPNLKGRVRLREFGKLDNVIRGLSLVSISYLFCLISLMPCPLYISYFYIVGDLLVLI